MNELLKGLIGAELTLLGIPSQPGTVPAKGTLPLPTTRRNDGTIAHAAGKTPGSEQAVSAIGFTQNDYRTAGG